MIEFQRVALRYDDKSNVLKDISFSLNPGSFHYLTGASGAGKTSLIRLLSLMQKASAGKIQMFGTPINYDHRAELVPVRRRIGLVYQDYRLLNHLTVYENVALPLKVKKTPRGQIKEHVGELLNWVGLGDKINTYPRYLSGGEQQRVSIARAVISQPHLLLADEPTGNLDNAISEKLLKLFEQLHRMGTTIVMATHNPDIIMRFPHPQLHLEDGKLQTRTAREAVEKGRGGTL